MAGETWTPVGKVAPTPKGAWSNSTAYTHLDIVSSGGSSYIANLDVPAGTAITNTTYWMKLADKGDTGNTGATGNGISSVEVEETSVSGSAHTYLMTISFTDGTSYTYEYEVTDGNVTSVNGRTGAVTGLAENDGYYENMTVGNAEQLLSSVYVDDSVPYNFRTSGGSADIGDRAFEDAVVGGTIAWNQMMPIPSSSKSMAESGVTIVDNRDGSYTVSTDSGGATAQITKGLDSISFETNHIYAILGSPSSSTSDNYFLYSATTGAITGSGKIYKKTSATSSATLSIIVKQGATITTPVKFVPNVFDLTQMFGSTIADYIYSLEQSNAGSGVAWFKSLFPKPYYPYSAGELIHVNASSHNTIGFNQWDEQWEVGGINAGTGQN